jgi:hypothetical protein
MKVTGTRKATMSHAPIQWFREDDEFFRCKKLACDASDQVTVRKLPVNLLGASSRGDGEARMFLTRLNCGRELRELELSLEKAWSQDPIVMLQTNAEQKARTEKTSIN